MVPGNGTSPVQLTDAQGNFIGYSLGFMVACPQCCAAEQIAGGDPDSKVFLSKEWMRHLYFLDAADTAKPVDAVKFFSFVQNEAGIAGCGLVSANVEVRRVSSNAGGGFSWATFPGGPYYAIVPDGTENSDGTVLPKIVLISTSKWDRTNSTIQKALTFVKNHLPASSPCPWS